MTREPLADQRTSPIIRLAEAFPTLQGVPGVNPWDPQRLDAWAAGPAPGSGARHAARFVLGLWDEVRAWTCGRFSVFEAMAAWDHEHREPFLTWVGDPWWP